MATLSARNHPRVRKMVSSLSALVIPGLGFQSFYTARRTLIGDETMNTIAKGQVYGVAKRDIIAQVKVVADIFALAA